MSSDFCSSEKEHFTTVLNDNNEGQELSNAVNYKIGGFTCKTKLLVMMTVVSILSTPVLIWLLSASLIWKGVDHETTKETILQKGTISDWSNSVCLTCSNVSTHSIGTSQARIHVHVNSSSDVGICCVKSSESIARLLQLILNERCRNEPGSILKTASQEVEQEEEPADTKNNGNHTETTEQQTMPRKEALTFKHSTPHWKRRKNAAHVYLNSSVMTSDQSHINASIPWTCPTPCKVSSNHEIMYDDSLRGFQIRKTAMYYIYSAVTFMAPTSDSPLKMKLNHSMRKRNSLDLKTGEQLLMENQYDENKQSHGYFTSFLSGTLTLQNGDELFVRVSNTSLVYNYYYSSYFGLYEVEANVEIRH